MILNHNVSTYKINPLENSIRDVARTGKKF